MKKIVKRDGRTVDFDESKIYNAIRKAQCDEEPQNLDLARLVTNDVVLLICDQFISDVAVSYTHLTLPTILLV